ncbi:MAG: YIP1 family protein [Candidatus Marsarchaeota archaeon]|nr:YIP1 family protein [Candidatus Marsarchaeota archaeon]
MAKKRKKMKNAAKSGSICSFAKVCGIFLEPGKATSGNLDLRKVLKFYFAVATIGFFLFLFFGSLAYHSGVFFRAGAIPLFKSFAISGVNAYAAILISGMAMFFVFIPISAVIDAWLYQIFGKYLLRAWDGNYSKTLIAVLFSMFPMVLGYWILFVPGVRILGFAIIAIWELAILVIALASQHNVSRVNAIVALFTTLVFLVLIALLLISGIAAGILHTVRYYPV